MNKKVAFGTRPDRANAAATPSADAWVQDRAATHDVETTSAKEPTKRLTIDVSADLHRRIKVRCAQEGVNIADVMRELLEGRFPVNAENR